MEKVGAYTERVTAEGEWQGGDVQSGLRATPMKAEYFNMLQRELVNVIQAAGIDLDKDDDGQLLVALEALIALKVPGQIVTSISVDTVLGQGQMGLVLVDAAGGNRAVTLPAADADLGVVDVILRRTDSATTTCSVSASAGDKIHSDMQSQPTGAGSVQLPSAGSWVHLRSNGAGKWFEVGATSLPQVGLRGAHRALKVSTTGTSAQVSISADALVVEDAVGQQRLLRNINLTINSAAAGANGLSSGALAANTWYAIWVWWNGSAVCATLDLSFTAPTAPEGYTHRARIGWARTDGSANKYPLGFVQHGRSVQLLALRDMASGVLAQWTAIAVGNFVPATAVAISGRIQNSNVICSVAPNASYDTYGVAYVYLPSGSGTAAQQFRVQLESSNIYGYSTASGSKISVLGWEDNL
ncbi:hypothetical protein [Pseudomonas sp. GZD-209]|uniref:hypothetical protein n=1 Tax=Pseudomonas sp. GZD-209 TaxID=3404807 RepID=UPI003BB76D9A